MDMLVNLSYAVLPFPWMSSPTTHDFRSLHLDETMKSTR
jgi:hypothetical protein